MHYEKLCNKNTQILISDSYDILKNCGPNSPFVLSMQKRFDKPIHNVNEKC